MVAALPEPAVCLMSKESEFPHTLSQNQSGDCTQRSSGSLPAGTSTHPQQGVSLVAMVIVSTSSLSSHPRADFIKVRIVLDLTGLYECGGYMLLDYYEKGEGGICSICYQNSDIMSSSHSSIDHTAGFSAS